MLQLFFPPLPLVSLSPLAHVSWRSCTKPVSHLLLHNSLARPRGAHADLQNVSNQVEPEGTPLTPVAQDPHYETYPKARMSFGNWNSPTMRLKEEPTSRVLSLRFVDDVFDP